jgi:hypothetical protein
MARTSPQPNRRPAIGGNFDLLKKALAPETNPVRFRQGKVISYSSVNNTVDVQIAGATDESGNAVVTAGIKLFGNFTPDVNQAVWLVTENTDIFAIGQLAPYGTAGGGGGVAYQANAPATPAIGDVWIESDVDVPDLFPSGFRNLLINGDMRVRQRTAFTTTTNTYQFTTDRWWVFSGTSTVGAPSYVTSSTLANFPNALRVQRQAGNTGTAYVVAGQTIESANVYAVQGKTLTLSFWARAGANYSGASNGLLAIINQGTGVDQGTLAVINQTWTGFTATTLGTATLTTSWQKFSYTYSVPSTATELNVQFAYAATGTAGANDYFDITGVQLEQGTVATLFEQRPVGTELELCQRYYHRLNGNGSTSLIGTGYAFSTTAINAPVLAVNSLRTQALSIDSSGFSVSRFASAGTLYNTGTTVLTSTLQAIGIPTITYTHGSAVFTVGEGIVLSLSSSGYIGFSAEL